MNQLGAALITVGVLVFVPFQVWCIMDLAVRRAVENGRPDWTWHPTAASAALLIVGGLSTIIWAWWVA